ncbi:SUMF1/EgtB/PvdO family nonheme iron enzyme [Desulfococcaceae bacterium HSG7]|nr:SUMF1/EgtB/PvdO family nonheme iron enzyme [Desulfococcaceae bacterium HSG7]
MGVSWYGAMSFSRWLNEKWSLANFLPENLTVILPSETEWEKAARGGETLPEKPVIKSIEKIAEQPHVPMEPNDQPERIYPWGDAPDENRSNVEESEIDSTSAAGCFPKRQSPYGCEEMSGNVWEWTLSLYDDHTCDPRTDWKNIPKITPNSNVVFRGGSFYNKLKASRCAYRGRDLPNDLLFSWDNGFRVALSPFPLDSETSGL